MSNSSTEVIKHVHAKLHSPNKKTINIVGIYQAPSHVVRARFLYDVGKRTNSYPNNKFIFLCDDINIDLLKLDSNRKS